MTKRDLEILKSIPGIAENTALRIISEIEDIRRFKNPNQLNAFVGVDPQVYESGNLTAQLSISKRGTDIGRKVLYLTINQIQSAKKAGTPLSYCGLLRETKTVFWDCKSQEGRYRIDP